MFFKAEEENSGLMKKISQLDSDLDKAQEQLSEANTKLEAAAKASADVSVDFLFLSCVYYLLKIGHLKMIDFDNRSRPFVI